MDRTADKLLGYRVLGRVVGVAGVGETTLAVISRQ